MLVGNSASSARRARRKVYQRGSVQFVEKLRRCEDDVEKAKADYEGDEYAKSAVESVQSRLLWWTARAGEHGIDPIAHCGQTPIVRCLVESCGVSLSRVVHEHGQEAVHQVGPSVDGCLGPEEARWEEGIGPPLKCGTFDLQRLANVQTTGVALFKGGRSGHAKARCVVAGGP